MKKIINVNDWEIDSLNVVAEYNDDKLRIINNNATSISFRCKKNLHFKEVIDGKLLVKFNGECCNSGGYLILNNNIKLPINSESSIYVKFPSIISLDLVVAAESEITISNIDFEFYESYDLVDKIDIKNGAVLTGSSTYLKLLIIHLITKAHDWVLKLTFANIVFLFVKSIRHLLL